jgi:hypothetical protein
MLPNGIEGWVTFFLCQVCSLRALVDLFRMTILQPLISERRGEFVTSIAGPRW